MDPAANIESSFLHDIQLVAQDAKLFASLKNYVKKLLAQKKDETLMTKEEFFAEVDEALDQAKRGEVTQQLPGESVTDMLRRTGYVV